MENILVLWFILKNINILKLKPGVLRIELILFDM